MAYSIDDLPEATPAPAPNSTPKDQVFFHGGMTVTPGQTPTTEKGDWTQVTTGHQKAAPPPISIASLPDAPEVKTGANTPEKPPELPKSQTTQPQAISIDSLPDHPDPGMDPAKMAQPITQELDRLKDSPIGRWMKYLNYPAQAVAAGAVKTIDTFSPGIQKQLNPDGQVFPDIGMSDVINYYTPDASAAKASMLANGVEPMTADLMAKAYWGTRTGLGVLANVFTDPLFFMTPKFMQMTKEAEALYKSGQAVEDGAKLEKNLVSLNIPYTDKQMVAIPASTVSDGIKATGQTVAKLPGGQKLVDGTTRAGQIAKDAALTLTDVVNPFTGILKIDVPRSAHKAAQRADSAVTQTFLKQAKALRLTDSERAVVRNAVESTPNLAIMNAPSTGMAEEALRPALADSIAKHAQDMKINVTPERIDQMVEGSMLVKKDNAYTLSRQVEAGHISPEDFTKHVLEGYLAHEISPQAQSYIKKAKQAALKGDMARAIMDAEKAAAITEAEQIKILRQSIGSSTVSSYDPTRNARSIRTTLDEANAIMKEKTKGAVKNWFIEDPFLATAQKNSKVRKMLRDKELLESISEFAVRPKDAAQARFMEKNGFAHIPHPDLEGKTVIIKDGNKTQKVKYQDLMFPKRIASKLSYDISPRAGGAMGNVNAFMDSYNRVFRGFALFKLDYHLENWLDNLLKNYINGVTIEDYADAARALTNGKGTITLNGKEKTVQEVQEILKRWNVQSSHFNEDLDSILFTGKKIATEQGLANKGRAAAELSADAIKKVVHGMNAVGAKGENYTRVAFFLSRLKQGYTAEMAAYEVEKYLFDFSRTTKGMDFMRRFYNPFIQAGFKTAQITPDLLSSGRGWVLNNYENTVMRTLQASFNDPVTSWAVQQLYPDYYKLHDRIAGPLLPGNHWLAIMAGADPKSKSQLPVAVSFGLPGGLGVLNQFLLYDQTVAKQATSGPVIRSLGILFSGKDPWTNQDIDIAKDKVNVTGRLNWAITQFIKGAIATPNFDKMMNQQMGIGDHQYVQAASLMFMHGAMGKFARLTNLDREFQFKIYALASAEKALQQQLRSVKAKESLGKTTDITFAGHPGLANLTNQTKRPFSSAEIYQMMTGDRSVEMQKTQLAGSYLRGEMDSATLINLIKNIRKTADDVNHNYQVMQQRYFEILKDAQKK